MSDEQEASEGSAWSAVVAMSVCAFALVAAEFLPVSLLTPMSADLGVSEGMTGQGIAISGVFAVVTSLFISSITRTMNRTRLLQLLTIAMALSGLTIGLATNYAMYMTGRALIGFVVGGFWSMSAATAIRLVAEKDVSRAIAIFNAGGAIATVVSAPLGAYLGAAIGWRGAFLCLVPISIIALFWLSFSLPKVMLNTSEPRPPLKIFSHFRKPIVSLGMLGGALFFMGLYTLYTYIRPFLENVTVVEVGTISLLFLEMGVIGVIGNALITRFLDWNFYNTLIGISAIMALLACLLVMLGQSFISVVIILGIWGFLSTAAPAGWWAWIARVFPNDAEDGGGLFVAIVQTAIAFGSTVGGILYDNISFKATFYISAFMLILSVIFTLLAARKENPSA